MEPGLPILLGTPTHCKSCALVALRDAPTEITDQLFLSAVPILCSIFCYLHYMQCVCLISLVQTQFKVGLSELTRTECGLDLLYMFKIKTSAAFMFLYMEKFKVFEVEN